MKPSVPEERPSVGEWGEIPDKAPYGSAIDRTHPCIGCHGEVCEEVPTGTVYEGRDAVQLAVFAITTTAAA